MGSLLTIDDFIHMPKGWGYEEWLVNNDNYCGKLLYIGAGKRMSYHYHKNKDETFILMAGKVTLVYGGKDVKSQMSLNMPARKSIRIPPGLVHQLIAEEDSIILEVSTSHEESDSYRIVKGDQLVEETTSNDGPATNGINSSDKS